MPEGNRAADESNIQQLEEDSPLRETRSDPFHKPRWWRETSTLSLIIASMIVFCFGITVAMIIQILVGAPQVIPHAGVLSNDKQCSDIAISALFESSASSYETASSVDVAILTSLCMVIKNVHKGGLGGGGFMLIEKLHDAKHDIVQIDFREKSPNGTDTNWSLPKDQIKPELSVAVPGFVQGMQVAHEKFGISDWNGIFKLSSKLAAEGVNVTEDLAAAIASLDLASVSDGLRSILTKEDNRTKISVNDTLKQPQLAKTLLDIGEDPESFYTGSLAESLVEVLSSQGSKITMADMKEYKAIWNTDVLKVNYSNMSVVAGGPPSSGPMVLSTLKSLSDNNSVNYNLLNHRMLEALKYSYGYQGSWTDSSEINARLESTKPLFKIDDDASYGIEHYLNGSQPLRLNTGGEQQVTVIGHDGLIVTVVIGIGSPFGSRILTSGYILNNAMLDFCWPGKYPDDKTGLPPSQVNRIGPGKRPMSSLTPVLVTPSGSKCGLYLSFGTNDGTSAISTLVQTVLRIGSGQNISTSINGARLNQDMVPYTVEAEAGVSSDLISYLKLIGHNITQLASGQNIGVCNGISYLEGKAASYPDQRDVESEAYIY